MIYLILSLGLGLRLISLNQSLWLDEAVQVWASKLPLNQFFGTYLPKDFNPPLYYLTTHYWIKIFGDGEVMVRITSVILGMLSVFILFLILMNLQITSYELKITLLLLTSSPLLIYYSQEARMYSLAVFTVLLSTWRLVAFLKNNSWLNAIFLGASLILMSMSHYLTLLTLPVLIIYLWQQKKLFKLKTGLAFFLLFLIWLLYLPIFGSQLIIGKAIKTTTPIWSQIIGQPTLKSGLLLPVKFIIGRISLQPQWLYCLIAGLLVLIYWGTAIMTIKIKKLKYKYLFACLLIFPPLIGFLISFVIPIFSYFRFLYCLPFLYLFIGLSPISNKIKYGMVIINLVLSGIYLFNPHFHRENWKGLAKWLNQQDQPQIFILNQVRFPLEYYYDGEINTLSNIDRIKPDNQVYLVSYGLPIFDPEDKIRERLKAEGLRLKAGESFRRVGVEVWRK